MQIPSLANRSSAALLAPEQLAKDSSLSEDQKIAEASRQFEAILVRQILETSQKGLVSSSDNSTAGSIYRDMITNQLADSISKSGALGLAQTFQRQLTHQAEPNLTKPNVVSASKES